MHLLLVPGGHLRELGATPIHELSSSRQEKDANKVMIANNRPLDLACHARRKARRRIFLLLLSAVMSRYSPLWEAS